MVSGTFLDPLELDFGLLVQGEGLGLKELVQKLLTVGEIGLLFKEVFQEDGDWSEKLSVCEVAGDCFFEALLLAHSLFVHHYLLDGFLVDLEVGLQHAHYLFAMLLEERVCGHFELVSDVLDQVLGQLDVVGVFEFELENRVD